MIPQEVDYVLVGTGLSTLLSLKLILDQGGTAILLNPEREFFSENSELDFSPVFELEQRSFLSAENFRRLQSEVVFEELSPHFPGPFNPLIKNRRLVWMGKRGDPEWEQLELSSVQGFVEGAKVKERDLTELENVFPGLDGRFRGYELGKYSEVDSASYREGLLQFLSQKYSGSLLLAGVGSIRFSGKSIRFFAEGKLQQVRIKKSMIVCWTPRLSPWIAREFQKNSGRSALWEDWLIHTRAPVDPTMVVFLEGFWIRPQGDRICVSTMRRVPAQDTQRELFNEESFSRLRKLCHYYFNWTSIRLREYRHRSLLKGADLWASGVMHSSKDEIPVQIFCEADGYIGDVVERTKWLIHSLQAP